jgi:hypothetical protein
VAPPSRGLLGGEEGKGGVADRPRPSELVRSNRARRTTLSRGPLPPCGALRHVECSAPSACWRGVCCHRPLSSTTPQERGRARMESLCACVSGAAARRWGARTHDTVNGNARRCKPSVAITARTNQATAKQAQKPASSENKPDYAFLTRNRTALPKTRGFRHRARQRHRQHAATLPTRGSTRGSTREGTREGRARRTDRASSYSVAVSGRHERAARSASERS